MVNGAQKGIVTIARRLGVQYDYVTVTAHADMRIECSADVCLCGLFRHFPEMAAEAGIRKKARD